jgi:hypothetical protein
MKVDSTNLTPTQNDIAWNFSTLDLQRSRKPKSYPRLEKLWEVIWEAEGYILVGFLLRKGTVNVIRYV